MLLLYPKFKAFDSNGDPLTGGKLYTYEAGTSTPKTTYSDTGLTTPNANPVVMDSDGEADVYLSGSFKLIMKDSDDVTMWTLDNIEGLLETTVTAFVKTLLDDASASAFLTTLGLSTFFKTLVDDADASAVLSTLGFSAFIKTLIDDADAATARATLGLGSMATQAKDAVDIDGGAIDGVTIGENSPGIVKATTLYGCAKVLYKTANYTLTVNDCKGGVCFVGAAATITLPALADVQDGACVTIYSTGANAIHLDPNAVDNVRLDGTVLSDGNKISSASAAGDHVTVIRSGDDSWITLGRSGTWTDGGA